MIEIVEMLRLWLQGWGLREVARVVGCFNWALTGRLTSSDCSKGHQMRLSCYIRGLLVASERPHAVPGLGFWLVEGQKLQIGERRAERQFMARCVGRREHRGRGRRVR